MYILEITNDKLDPAEMEDRILYHIRKWKPEKVGIESFQAQSMIAFSLKNRLRNEGLWTSVEEITQKGDKETKIRRLVPLYRNGQIYHKAGVCDELEKQLIKFPRGSHDDMVDSTQMLYNMYELQPNIKRPNKIRIEHDRFGRPKIIA